MYPKKILKQTLMRTLNYRTTVRKIRIGCCSKSVISDTRPTFQFCVISIHNFGRVYFIVSGIFFEIWNIPPYGKILHLNNYRHHKNFCRPNESLSSFYYMQVLGHHWTGIDENTKFLLNMCVVHKPLDRFSRNFHKPCTSTWEI